MLFLHLPLTYLQKKFVQRSLFVTICIKNVITIYVFSKHIVHVSYTKLKLQKSTAFSSHPKHLLKLTAKRRLDLSMRLHLKRRPTKVSTFSRRLDSTDSTTKRRRKLMKKTLLLSPMSLMLSTKLSTNIQRYCSDDMPCGCSGGWRDHLMACHMSSKRLRDMPVTRRS